VDPPAGALDVTPPVDGVRLALDASTAFGSVAVGTGDRVLAEVTFGVPGSHSTSLLPAADHALELSGHSRSSLAAVVLGAGPGSFTGLRIAAATAKGIAAGLGIPLEVHSSLLAVAAGAGVRGHPFLVLFDARGRDVFAAAYRIGEEIETIQAPAALTLDEVVERFADRGPLVAAGDGAIRHRVELEGRLAIQVLPPVFGAARGSALLWLSGVAGPRCVVADPASWEPDYLRASGAERIAAARASS
jgi:tRNA threonylcarbamoyl adenosine modification protein YeaZ